MNSIQIFNNEQFGRVRVIMSESNEPLFCAKDVAAALGYSDTNDAISRHCKSGKKVFHHHANGIGGVNMIYIPEKDLYRLIMRSNLPEAEEFQDWVCGVVLPSIRKHGAYMTNETLEKALTSPDFLIQLAYQLKEEQQKRIAAEQLVSKQQEVISHKSDVIEGLIDDLPLAKLRQRITQIVRYGSVNFQKRYQLLYKEFELKYHMSLNRRINSAKVLAIKPEIKNKMDYIDRVLGMIPELYDIACKLFETDVKKLIKREWKISSL